MCNLPKYNKFMKRLEEFDGVFNKTVKRSKQFPTMCFEASLLIYLYLKSKNLDNVVDIKCGEIITQDGGNHLHQWVEFNNNIIDYTRIQFIMDIPTDSLKSVLEKAYNENMVQYIFPINSKEYSKRAVFDLNEKHDCILKYIIDKNVSSFDEMCDILFKYLYEEFNNLSDEQARVEWILNLMPTTKAAYKFWWENERSIFWRNYEKEKKEILMLEQIMDPIDEYEHWWTTNQRKTFFKNLKKDTKHSFYICSEMKKRGHNIPPIY